MNTLLHYPIQMLSFFSLAMAFLSIWIKKNPILFGSFGFISISTAFASGLITSIALLPLAFFLLLLFGLKTHIQGLSRFLLASTAFLIGGSLFFHFMPGFLEKESFESPTCLNYGKAFVGFLLIGYFVQTISGKELASIFFPAISGTLALIALSLYLKKPTLEFHFSLSFISWSLTALFFSIIPEEALLRGFLQKELFDWIGGGMKAHLSCIAITSMLYPLFHINWAGNISLLLPTLATGLTLGVLYQVCRKVEVCIGCHFLIRCCSFLLFGSYLACP